MGNMLVNKRVEEAVSGPTVTDKEEYRIWPEHMYKGPKNLGDPFYRELSKMEEDPVITQRMRDISRAVLCTDAVDKFVECGRSAGFKVWFACRKERDGLVECMDSWINRPGFKERVVEEYLNERSHYRQTGMKTKRYTRGAFVKRDLDRDGPPLDSQGMYVPQKPQGWDESYPDQPPPWATYKYKRI